jgi:DNA-binding transcriptional ArsR family regulator
LIFRKDKNEGLAERLGCPAALKIMGPQYWPTIFPSAFLRRFIFLYINILQYLDNHMSDLPKFKAEFFKALAHPLRIRIIDELRDGEIGVNDLCARLNVEQSSVSQQLAQLRSRNIVMGRKEGQNVYYSIRDKAIFRLLDVAKEIFNNHLIGVQDMLSELEASSDVRR